MTDTPAALADEYWEFRHRTDGMQRLWRGDTDHLELMEDVSLDGTASRLEALERFAARADAFRPDPLAETVAFTAGFVAKVEAPGRMVDQLTERLRHNASVGLTPIDLAVRRTAEAVDRYLATPLDGDPLTRVQPPPGLSPDAAARYRRDLEAAACRGRSCRGPKIR